MQDSKATSGSSPYDTAADVSGLVGLPVLAANGVELGKVILALRYIWRCRYWLACFAHRPFSLREAADPAA